MAFSLIPIAGDGHSGKRYIICGKGAVKKFGVEEEFIIYWQIKIERFKYYESRYIFMQLNIISTFENCIASVQLKLSDYISKVLGLKKELHLDYQKIGLEI